jgi:hypothetical protein
VFVFVLDSQALSSTACKREYGYAADLGKPILPVLVGEGLSTNLLPPALSQIQFVDYRKRDRNSVLRLARALTSAPAPKPLPDPLPPPPELPISYLGRLAEQIETVASLNYGEQSALVVDLKRSLRDPETAADAVALTEKLRRRRDLFATIAEEIDEFLVTARKASSDTPGMATHAWAPQARPSDTPRAGKSQEKTEPPEPMVKAARLREEPFPATPTPRDRATAAFVGGLVGAVVGFAGVSTDPSAPGAVGLLASLGGAFAAAISGTRRPGIVGILVGAALGWVLVLSIMLAAGETRSALAAGTTLGAPPGAILGALVERLWARRKRS